MLSDPDPRLVLANHVESHASNLCNIREVIVNELDPRYENGILDCPLDDIDYINVDPLTFSRTKWSILSSFIYRITVCPSCISAMRRLWEISLEIEDYYMDRFEPGHYNRIDIRAFNEIKVENPGSFTNYGFWLLRRQFFNLFTFE